MSILNDSRLYRIDRRLLGPIVYILHVANNIVYIGSSRVGVARTFASGHRMNPVLKLNNLEISILFCSSEKEARETEIKLIKEYQPMGNNIHSKDNPYIDVRRGK